MFKEFKMGTKGCYTPNEVHSVLAYAFNRWIGRKDKPSVTFRDDVTLFELLKELKEGRAVVMSGRFPYNGKNGPTEIGHINTLVGIDTGVINHIDPLLKYKPVKFIFDDPWGSVHQNFAPGTGDDVELDYEQFIKWYKNCGSTIKWAHIFKSAAATI